MPNKTELAKYELAGAEYDNLLLQAGKFDRLDNKYVQANQNRDVD